VGTMSPARRPSSSLVVVVLFVVGGIWIAPLAAQSLGDIAKKEGERRETIKVPAKTYTNKDLQPAPNASAPAAGASDKTGDSAPDAKADGGAKSDKGKDDVKESAKDKAYWSDKLKGLQQQLDRDQGYATALQSRINSLTTDAVNRDDPIQRGLLERERQKAVAELNRLTKAVTDDQKAISDLLEEARRAGVPAGWLR
jgi:hypothetical protein